MRELTSTHQRLLGAGKIRTEDAMRKAKRRDGQKLKRDFIWASTPTKLSADMQWAKDMGMQLQYDWLEHDYAADARPILASLRSAEALPWHLRLVLIDLLDRHYLKPKKDVPKIPFYRRPIIDRKIEAAKSELFAFGDTGQIDKEEMERAVEIQSQKTGRSSRALDPMEAAKMSRTQQRNVLAREYEISAKVFENSIAGRRSSLRRKKPDPMNGVHPWGTKVPSEDLHHRKKRARKKSSEASRTRPVPTVDT